MKTKVYGIKYSGGRYDEYWSYVDKTLYLNREEPQKIIELWKHRTDNYKEILEIPYDFYQENYDSYDLFCDEKHYQIKDDDVFMGYTSKQWEDTYTIINDVEYSEEHIPTIEEFEIELINEK